MAYNQEDNKRVTVDMPKEAYKKIEKMAEEEDRSISSMVRVLVLIALKAS